MNTNNELVVLFQYLQSCCLEKAGETRALPISQVFAERILWQFYCVLAQTVQIYAT